MHPLQLALKSAIEARETAAARVHALRIAENDLQLRITTAESQIVAAREALKNAHDAEVVEAKAEHDEARAALELCHLRLEGTAEKIAIAEADLVRAERVANIATSDVCVHIVHMLEATALDCARRLGPLTTRRRQLARMAGIAMTSATGHAADPCGGQHLGELTAFHRELNALLEARETAGDPITVADLLAWPLPAEAVAAE